MRRGFSAAVWCFVVMCGIAATSVLQAQEQQKPSAAQDIEKKVLELLASGRQAEAEQVLLEYLHNVADIPDAIDFLVEGNPNAAKELINKHKKLYQENQRVVFLFTACQRSRFARQEMRPFFLFVWMTDETTAVGKCSMFMAALDRALKPEKPVQVVFADFEKLVGDNPDDIVVRWMLAVQCRTYNRNKQGVVHYKKIVEKWKPGPVLVHQTYGNLLDGLKLYEEALVERRMAVELEPAGWSYDGLGNTLDNLGRFDEAEQAHKKATELNPQSGHHMANWAHCLLLNKKIDEAIKKCELASKIDAEDPHVWKVWAMCLNAKGDKIGAAKIYYKLLTLGN